MGRREVRWDRQSPDPRLTCTCPRPLVCPHRTRARLERRAEIAREYRPQNLPLPEILSALLQRIETGEFIGQDDGDILREEFLTQHFRVTDAQVQEAARHVGVSMIAGVLLPKF